VGEESPHYDSGQVFHSITKLIQSDQYGRWFVQKSIVERQKIIMGMLNQLNVPDANTVIQQLYSTMELSKKVSTMVTKVTRAENHLLESIGMHRTGIRWGDVHEAFRNLGFDFADLDESDLGEKIRTADQAIVKREILRIKRIREAEEKELFKLINFHSFKKTRHFILSLARLTPRPIKMTETAWVRRINQLRKKGILECSANSNPSFTEKGKRVVHALSKKSSP